MISGVMIPGKMGRYLIGMIYSGLGKDLVDRYQVSFEQIGVNGNIIVVNDDVVNFHYGTKLLIGELLKCTVDAVFCQFNKFT